MNELLFIGFTSGELAELIAAESFDLLLTNVCFGRYYLFSSVLAFFENELFRLRSNRFVLEADLLADGSGFLAESLDFSFWIF